MSSSDFDYIDPVVIGSLTLLYINILISRDDTIVMPPVFILVTI